LEPPPDDEPPGSVEPGTAEALEAVSRGEDEDGAWKSEEELTGGVEADAGEEE